LACLVGLWVRGCGGLGVARHTDSSFRFRYRDWYFDLVFGETMMRVYWINKARFKELHELTWPDVPFKQFVKEMEILLEGLTKMGLRMDLEEKTIHGKRPLEVWVEK
jgi:hypothetical protein